MNIGLASLVVMLVLSGCTNHSEKSTSNQNNAVKVNATSSKEEELPKPYQLAIEQLNQGDLDHALQYLDLTIRDFKNSKYYYNANLIKSIIIRAKLVSIDSIISILSNGVESNAKVLYTNNDVEKIRSYSTKLKSEIDEVYPGFKDSIKYIYENYDTSKEQFTFNIKYPYSYDYNSSETSLDFFKNVGYPIPDENDIKTYEESDYKKTVSYLLSDIIQNNKINYPKYFYYMGTGVYSNGEDKNDKDFAKNLLNKVMVLTENDKYNKTRLDAESVLNDYLKRN